ncbi:nucleoside phosphorylase [Macrococcus animalis]|uniref:nucleoside phosphorylase n=1 Tax=Macrococcus animalis TaxID=3395467 RepID=UPI0039BDB0E1
MNYWYTDKNEYEVMIMITDSFDNQSEPIVTMQSFYGEQNHIIDICMIILSKRIYDNIFELYECELITEIHVCNGSYPIYKFNHEGKDIGFYLTGIGSTLASQFCIEANWLTGATKFIMSGSAGSLDKDKTHNKFVIPTESYRDEGMSYHYAKASDYIRIKNSNVVAEIFDNLELPHIQGKVWTTDAMLRETKNNVEKRKNDGCIAVEMELAGVQAVCNYHGLELYNFLSTGDVVSEDEYEVEGLSGANHNMDKFYIGLEIANRISKNI